MSGAAGKECMGQGFEFSLGWIVVTFAVLFLLELVCGLGQQRFDRGHLWDPFAIEFKTSSDVSPTSAFFLKVQVLVVVRVIQFGASLCWSPVLG